MSSDSPPKHRARVVYSPVDALRLGVALLGLGLVVVLVNYGAASLAGAETDLLKLTARLPEGLTKLAVRLVQLVALVAPVAGAIALLVRRQFRRLSGSVIAAVAGGVIGRWIMTDLLQINIERLQITNELAASRTFPSAAFLASISAIVAADSPWMSMRWRHAARAWLALLVALRLFSGSSGLRELIVAVAVGWFVGSVVGALVGAPDRRPTESAVEAALTRLGVSVESVDHDRSWGGRHHYRVARRSGDSLWVEVAARDGWQTMLPGRIYRALRFRDAADDRPLAGLRELTEHEALIALKARGDGVPTPEVEAIGEVDPDGYLVAYRLLDGTSLATQDDLDASVLSDVWQIVVRLRQARIAHRGLDQSSILVQKSDRALFVVRFDDGELTGDERVLSSDVAEVLAWGSERFGVEPAVDSAIAALGPGVVARALPRLQPLALTRRTRGELTTGTLDKIAELVRQRTGADEPTLAPIERIKPRSILMAVMSVVAINALVPQLAGFSKVWGELQDANLAWIVGAVIASIATYLFAATSLAGSVVDPLPVGPNLAVQVAGSFAAIAAPAQVGGVALKGRFLQRRGIDPAIAVASIGLNTVVAFLVHLTILVAFVLWAGNGDFSKIKPPSGKTIGLGIGAVVALILIGAALPAGRKFLRESALPAVRRSASAIAGVARRPVRLAELVGGSAGITLSYSAALICSVYAFNGALPASAIAIVYLIGAVVQSVAPTPGGLGAAEAAYIGGLTAIGLSSERAVVAVLLFRLLTFWIPVLPGWVAMNWLQRTAAL